MAVLLRGMTHREATELTLIMAHSGDMLDLHPTAPFVVDKHSTGSVGDKTTLVVVPLVASSIMSKKIVAGADAIVLDVKVGKGAFMKTEAKAEELAGIMVAVGRRVGRQAAAIISEMNQAAGLCSRQCAGSGQGD